jgi:DNA-binding GntR family transcriptional regulator
MSDPSYLHDVDSSSERVERGLLVDKVAQRIRTEILDGALTPGQRIPVSTLSARLGVSPIPIREALRRLEAEALVRSVPHHAPVVADVDVDELGQVYDLRRLIEPDTARAALAAADPAAFELVSATLHRLRTCDPQDPDTTFWQAHTAFHTAVLEAGLDPWRRRILSLLWQSSQRYQRLNTLVFGLPDGDIKAHTEIAEAFFARDADRLAAAITAHLETTESNVRAGYSQKPAPSGEGEMGPSATTS